MFEPVTFTGAVVVFDNFKLEVVVKEAAGKDTVPALWAISKNAPEADASTWPPEAVKPKVEPTSFNVLLAATTKLELVVAESVNAVTTASVVKLVEVAPDTVKAAKALVVPAVVVFILMVLPLPTDKEEEADPVMVPAPDNAPETVNVLLPIVSPDPEPIATVATVKLADIAGVVELLMIILDAEVGTPPHQLPATLASAPFAPCHVVLLMVILVPLSLDCTLGVDELILILYPMPGVVPGGIVISIVPEPVEFNVPSETGLEKLPDASESCAENTFPPVKEPPTV